MADHLGGSWSGSSLIILSPGDKIVEENGVPNNLNAVDTFWARDVLIPEGSKLLSFYSEPIHDFLNVAGIENKLVKIPDDLRGSLLESIVDFERCSKGLESKKVTIDDYCRAESEKYYWMGKVKEMINEAVNGELREMGYEIFKGDHGTYMDGSMADPIYDLAKVEEITSGMHVDTLLGGVEMGDGLFVQPLMQLALESDKDLFKVREDGKTDFLNVVQKITGVLVDSEVDSKDLSEGEEKQLLILATELYNRVRGNEQILWPEMIRSLRRLLDSSRLIRKNWQDWDMEMVRDIYNQGKEPKMS